MSRLRLSAVLLYLLCATVSGATDKEDGLCDTSAQRERRTQQYNVESRNDTASTFVAKRPCSDEMIRIKLCALIVVRDQKVQRFCYRSDRPDYYEYFDVVEYWGGPSRKPGTQ